MGLLWNGYEIVFTIICVVKIPDSFRLWNFDNNAVFFHLDGIHLKLIIKWGLAKRKIKVLSLDVVEEGKSGTEKIEWGLPQRKKTGTKFRVPLRILKRASRVYLLSLSLGSEVRPHHLVTKQSRISMQLTHLFYLQK